MTHPKFLVWVNTLGKPCPQAIYDAVGSKPFIDAGIAGSVISYHKLSEDDGRLSLKEKAARYPVEPLPLNPTPVSGQEGE